MRVNFARPSHRADARCNKPKHQALFQQHIGAVPTSLHNGPKNLRSLPSLELYIMRPVPHAQPSTWHAPEHTPKPPAFDSVATRDRLRAVMFTDIVGSVSLAKRLGERAYRHLQSHHHRVFYDIVGRFDDAHVVQTLGDGFFVTFRTTADAVRAALLFQHALRLDDRFVVPCPIDSDPDQTPRPTPLERLAVRIGIHLGALPDGDAVDGATRMATNLANRIMSLARSGQILVTRAVYDTAEHSVDQHPALGSEAVPADVRWMRHGSYRFFGIDDDEYEVIEVGGADFAPFRCPPDSDKAWRVPAGFPRFLRWISMSASDATPHMLFNTEQLRDYLNHAQLGDYVLLVLSGRDAGAAYQLEGEPPYIVGRITSRSTPDIPVNDPYISRRHLLLDWSPDNHTLYLSVMPGACPVQINGRTLPAPPANATIAEATTVRHPLRDGDRIAIESTHLVLLKLPRSADFQAYLDHMANRRGGGAQSA
ncbi:MAG: FHA domain-containing protein [Phycisphaera sp.]|nr:FHA domain-containing protein [Phycisphaera sp.]